MFCNARGPQEKDQRNGCGGCNGRETPGPNRENALPADTGFYAFPYPGRDRFLRLLQNFPYGYVKILFFHCFSFIISCSLMRARCSLEREVASVQPSSWAISLWE